MERTVYFLSQGQRIVANLCPPIAEGPILLMSHGLEGSKDGSKWQAMAAKAPAAGFGTLRFNYRGCGEGMEASEGEFPESTLTNRITDYRAAIEYIYSINTKNNMMGVIGSSFGGMVALAAEDIRVKAMVLLATPLHLSMDIEHGKTWGAQTSVSPSLLEQIHDDVKCYDLCKSIRKINCPILILHGSEDGVVPVEHAYDLYRHANEPKHLHIVDGADHSFSNPVHVERIIDLSITHLIKYL